MSFGNPASDNPDVAAVSLEGEELVIEGQQTGSAAITLEVSDGLETVPVTIHANVEQQKASRISVNTMPKNYPLRRYTINSSIAY